MAKTRANKLKRRPAKTVARRSAKPAAPRGPSAAEGIHKLGQAFMKGVTGKDSQGLVRAFYAPDAVLMPPNQPTIVGRENIRLALQGMIDAGVTSLEIETLAVGASGDLAWERASYTLAMTPPDGPPAQDVGKSLVVYRRQPSGQWRAIVDMYSSDQPAKARRER